MAVLPFDEMCLGAMWFTERSLRIWRVFGWHNVRCGHANVAVDVRSLTLSM